LAGSSLRRRNNAADVAARFLAYGWTVQRVGDANDTIRLAQAIENFRRAHDRPTLVIVDSHIAYGAPHKHDTTAAHGEPLGDELYDQPEATALGRTLLRAYSARPGSIRLLNQYPKYRFECPYGLHLVEKRRLYNLVSPR
jgi:hypothetical protein